MMQPLSIVQYAKSGFWFYRAYYLSLATLGKIVILPLAQPHCLRSKGLEVATLNPTRLFLSPSIDS